MSLDPIYVNVVGTLAALCSIVSFVPQIVKIVRERDASSVSLRMYFVTVTGFALWVTYGTMLESWPLIVANTANLVLAATILVLKYRYR